MITINRGYGVNSFSGQKNPSLSFGYDEQANKDLREFAKKTPYDYEIRTLQKMSNKLETKITKDEITSSIKVDDVGIFVNLKAALASMAENTAKEVNFTQREYDHYTKEQEKINQSKSNSNSPSDDLNVPEDFDSENIKNWRRIVASVIIAPFVNDNDETINDNKGITPVQTDKYVPSDYGVGKDEISIYE